MSFHHRSCGLTYAIIYHCHSFNHETYENELENVLLYVVKFIELLITGAAGGAIGSSL